MRDLMAALGDVLLIAECRGARLGTPPDPGTAGADEPVVAISGMVRALAASEGLDLATFPGSTAASAGAARRFVRGVTGAWKLPAETANDLDTVTGELVGNAVSYGGLGVITVSLARRPASVTVCVIDDGDGPKAPAPLPAPPGVAGQDEESGRGLMIVEALAERWGWRRTGRGGLAAWAAIATGSGER